MIALKIKVHLKDVIVFLAEFRNKINLFTVAMQKGIVFLQISQFTSVSGSLFLQYGQGVNFSVTFSILFFGGFLTMASIRLIYFESI